MSERVEVHRVSLWQAYKQGVGVGLGILTVYVLALLLLGVFVTQALSSSGGGQEAPSERRTVSCSTSWV